MRRPGLGRVLAGRGRRRIAAALAVLLTVGAVVWIVAGVGSSSPKRSNSSGGESGATTVQRRDLVETDTESGKLSHADPQTVYDRLNGTITWLPSVGQVVKPGQALFKVGGEPVILMDGRTPAYRDLSASDSAGQDILELNRNLVDLGFNPDGIVVDDEWQAATTAGVEALQASLSETETGSLSLGRVVFLPGDQLVSTVDATLGSTGGGSGQAIPPR
jgi:membrane fusion protein, multidrug efflux system